MHAEKAWDAFRLYRAHPGRKPRSSSWKTMSARVATSAPAMVRASGRLDGTRLKSDEAPTITYLGIFETVGQRGVPSALGGMARFFNKRFGFHDMTIGQSVLSARHRGGGGREPARVSADAVGGRGRGRRTAALPAAASTIRSAGSSARMAMSAVARALLVRGR